VCSVACFSVCEVGGLESVRGVGTCKLWTLRASYGRLACKDCKRRKAELAQRQAGTEAGRHRGRQTDTHRTPSRQSLPGKVSHHHGSDWSFVFQLILTR